MATTQYNNFSELTNEDLKKVYDDFVPEELRVGYYPYRGYVLTPLYQTIEESIENMVVHNDDVWITSVPKSGTTWLSETVWSICNNLNSQEAKLPLNDRVRFLEYSSLYRFDEDQNAPSEVKDSVRKIEDCLSRPRFIKTHLPWECLPQEIRNFTKRPRVIHIARDPKDVAVSYYHHNRLFRGYCGPQELFYEMVLRDLIRWAPFDNNVLSYWNRRCEANVLFLRFEEMKSNMPGVIEKIGAFLNVEVSGEKMAELLQHLSFGNMKKNNCLGVDDVVKYINAKYLSGEDVGSVMRRGETGAHKGEMSLEIAARFEQRFTYYYV